MKKLRVTVDGKSYDVVVEEIETGSAPVVHAAPASVSAPAPVAAPAPAAAPVVAASGDAVPSPLAGRVVSIDCAAGQSVASGDKLVTLEAMKMHTFVYAHKAGTVGAIHVASGDAVEEGQALISLS